MDKLDKFDVFLKQKAQRGDCHIPEDINKNIESILRNLPENRRHKGPILKVALIVAVVTALSATTVLANTNPTVKSMISGIVSYFENTKETRYASDKLNFEKFNKSVGISTEDKGIKFTVDNIATDDNFINIFYTIESQESIDLFPNDDEAKLFEAFLSAPFLNLKINGKEANWGNNNDTDAYFENDKTLKVMRRFNVSQIDLPEKFTLEISTDEIFRTEGKWGVATNIDKSDIAVETKTVEPNIKKTIHIGDYKHNITIDKVSISPFGSQIVITERTWNDRLFHIFAIFDDKGNNLDVLNTDMTGGGFGKSKNSFEFIKGNKDVKYISLVPIKFEESGKAIEEKADIGKLPIVFKTNNTGSRVVDNIEFDKNVIRIKYHNEGVQLWNPAFLFYDENENVDFSKIAKIGTFTGIQHIELLEDQAIKIDLQ